MNSWFNILCIMMILCAQDYFGVCPVIAGELDNLLPSKEISYKLMNVLNEETTPTIPGEYDNLFLNKSERIIVHGVFTNLYQDLKKGLENDKVKINRLDAWANDKDIKNDVTGEGELHNAKPYINWAIIGARLIITANLKTQEERFNARIKEAKKKIQESVNEKNAKKFNEILCELMEDLNEETTTSLKEELNNLFLSKAERETVYEEFTNLYKYVEKELNNDKLTKELEELANDEDIKNDVTGKGELHYANPYIKWVIHGVIAIKTAKPQEKRFDDRIDKAKTKIQENVNEKEAAVINALLNCLKEE